MNLNKEIKSETKDSFVGHCRGLNSFREGSMRFQRRTKL